MIVIAKFKTTISRPSKNFICTESFEFT